VITFTTADGTAASGSDYTGQTTVSYTIPAGSTSINIPVDVLGDLISEPSEAFTATIAISNANGQNASITTATATSSIIDDEIFANDDAGVIINSYTGGVAVADVLLNDQIYGSFPTLSDVILSQVSSVNQSGIPTTNVILNADGSVTVLPTTPAGTYTLTYQICEIINPSNCDQAIVTIVVVAPIIYAADDAGIVNGMDGGSAVSNVLDNDILNGSQVIPAEVIISVVTPASDPGVVLDPVSGEVTVAPGTPAGTYIITYQVCDTLNPGNCDQAIVTVTVIAAPIVATDDAGSISGINGGIAVTNILTNDLLNGNPINPSDITIGFISSTEPGVSLVGNSVVVAPGTPAGVYYLIYEICEVLNPANCEQATVTITVTNDPPSVTGTTVSTQEDTPITVCLPISDPDAGSVFTASVCGNPANGTLGVPTVSGNQVCVTFTPALDYNGADQFCISICDNGKPALCDTAIVTINIIPVDDPPVVTGIITNTPEDTPITVCLPISDPDAGSVFTAGICGAPANGTLGTPVVAGNQVCVTYTPNHDYNGTEQFCIRVCDNGAPVLCDTALITISVIPVNDEPVVFNEYDTVCNNSVFTGNIMANGDFDPDGTTLSVATTPLTGPSNGSFTIQSNGDYTYTPSAAFGGTDMVVVSLCDEGIPMPSICRNDTITLTVIPSVVMTAGADTLVCEAAGNYTLGSAQARHFSSILWTTNGTGTFNDPTLINPTYTAGASDISTGNVVLTMHINGLTPCSDLADSITLTFAPAPESYAGKDVTICNSAAFDFNDASAENYSSLLWEYSPANAGTLSNSAALKPVFTPAAGFTGNVTLTLKAFGSPVCSTVAASDEMILTIVSGITLNAGIDQVVTAGAVTTLQGTATGGSGVYAWSWAPTDLLESNIIPQPDTKPINSQTLFSVTVLDIISGCSSRDEMVVSINVEANADYDSTDVNNATSIHVLNNDSDPGTETRNVSICGDPLHGTVVINPDNTITYKPDEEFIGDDKFCYMLCSNGNPALCDTAAVMIHVIAKIDDLVIYNLVTPNGDNSNDSWFIRGIEDYPDNTIVIFNRWGDKVRDFSRYDNTNVFWDGTNNKGELLPSSTYYYILTIKDVGSRTGWIYIRGNEE